MSIKAIIINEKGSFTNLNGQTFDVKESDMCDSYIPILIPDVTTPTGFVTLDCPLKNVLFVDADKVGQALYDAKNWNGKSKQWYAFVKWAIEHKFVAEPVTPEYIYSCEVAAYFDIQLTCPS